MHTKAGADRHITCHALCDLPLHMPATVARIDAPSHSAEWARWLEEIGFLPGEQVSVMAHGVPGADPLVVRVGGSTFALRRAEAACIAVVPAPELRHA